MAVKATKNDAALSVMDGGFNPLANLVEPERATFLPTLKLVYPADTDMVLPVIGDDGKPIVQGGKPITKSAAGHVVITAGKGKIELVKAPYLITTYCIRGATRKWTGEKYERTFTPINGSTNPAHEEALAKSKDKSTGVDAGNVALVVVLTNDGKGPAAVCTLDMFRTLTKYWGEVLKNGMLLGDSAAVRINIEDHSVNMKMSSSGLKYYNYGMFNQWSRVDLTDEQKTLAREALKANQKACDEWLNRAE